MTTTYAVLSEGLEKRFGAVRALRGLDLAVAEGTVCGLLGPNGAGKTTAVRLLTTLLRPDAGSARVAGHDLVREAAAVRRLIGVTGQYASVDGDLTGRQNLRLFARLHRVRGAAARADELLDRFGLADAADRPAATLSGGMRRRLDLAASLVRRPEVLFLDEPTTGLDPASRNRVWETVRALKADGTTVLLTTQYLEEADRLADDIALVDRGRV
ncbi:ATP-binding cassette domain-containing protein, partial [Streptomyces sp. SID5926]|nr:ATP-binding cassette domain-containing protein [Streptomyces sp. SID5926]